MNDDLRHVKENVLPKLAYCIGEPLSRIPSKQFANCNRMHRGEGTPRWKEFDKTRELDYLGTSDRWNTTTFFYGSRHHAPGYARGGPGATWNIAIYALDLVDIEDQEFLPAEIDEGEVELVEVFKKTNNSSSFKDYASELEKIEVETKDRSFSVEAKSSFELAMTRAAEAGIGIAKGKEELSAKFSSSLSARTDQAWSSSDTLRNLFKESYTVFPHTTREITVKRGQPSIRQRVPTRGILDCKVGIYIASGRGPKMEWYFENLRDLKRCYAGLLPGKERFSSWFTHHSLPQEEIDAWPQPVCNLDIEVKGDRVRYTEENDQQYVIKGKEAEFEKANAAYLKGVEGGHR